MNEEIHERMYDHQNMESGWSWCQEFRAFYFLTSTILFVYL